MNPYKFNYFFYSSKDLFFLILIINTIQKFQFKFIINKKFFELNYTFSEENNYNYRNKVFSSNNNIMLNLKINKNFEKILFTNKKEDLLNKFIIKRRLQKIIDQKENEKGPGGLIEPGKEKEKEKEEEKKLPGEEIGPGKEGKIEDPKKDIEEKDESKSGEEGNSGIESNMNEESYIDDGNDDLENENKSKETYSNFVSNEQNTQSEDKNLIKTDIIKQENIDTFKTNKITEDINNFNGDNQKTDGESIKIDNNHNENNKKTEFILNSNEDKIESSKNIIVNEISNSFNNKEIHKTDIEIQNSNNKTFNNNEETDYINKTKNTEEINKDSDFNNENEISYKINNSDKIDKNSEALGNNCTIDEIINNECNKTIDNKQINQLYDNLQKDLVENGYKEQKEIYTENTVFQISTLEEQKNNENKDISLIDLGDCEDKLKTINDIPEYEELIILKVDIKYNISIYVQYEVYDPIRLVKLDLNICKDSQISINLPVKLDNNIQTLYDSLDESGYNLFDLNDSFYNDVCSIYTTGNGTDISLNDRKKDIYHQTTNLSFCQKGCTFQSYNSSNNKVKCNCQVEIVDIQNIFNNITFTKNVMIDNFVVTIKNSNFKVLKCYKLLIDINNLKYNIGCIIMTIIFILLLIVLIIHYLNEKKNINYFIQLVLMNLNKSNKNNKNIKKNYLKKTQINCNIKIKDKKKKEKNLKQKNNNKKENKLNKKKEYKQKNKKYRNIKNKSLKINNSPPKKKSIINDINSSSSKTALKMSKNNILDSNKNIKKNFISKNEIKIYSPFSNSQSKSEKISYLKNKDYPNINKYKNHFLNDQELNNLEYKKALLQDKRTYFQYYWSLLKRKQLILFSFFPNNDYNLRTIKISLFLISFSLYFTMNGFFFTDETMHKLYEDKGTYNILYQLPKILYSALITSTLNTILRFLSLSEDSILSLKNEENYKKAYLKADKIKKCLKIRIIIFYILCFIFMLFFWLFISCFCAVYINTQMILIIDTILSFSLSMIYPFGLNLIPGMLRITSLRAPKKNKNFLYKISRFIAFL